MSLLSEDREPFRLLSMQGMSDQDESDLFTFSGSVGPNGENRREDVIRAQTLLASTGDFQSPFEVPTGWPSSDLWHGIKKFQKRKGVDADGTLLPTPPGGVDQNGIGETVRALQGMLGGQLAGRKAPAPKEVDAHYENEDRFRNTMDGEEAAAPAVSDIGGVAAPIWQDGARTAQAASQPRQPARPAVQGTQNMPPVQPLEHVDPDQGDLWPDSPIHLRFRDEIARREVGDVGLDGYGVKHESGALGRYQFTDIAQRELGLRDRETGKWNPDNAYGAKAEAEFLKSAEAQEKAIAEYLKRNDEFIDKQGVRAHVGQKVEGIKETFAISEAGLAAAAHRQGARAVKRYLDHVRGENWKSDVNALPESHRKTEFLRVETRLREFSAVPYRRDR